MLHGYDAGSVLTAHNIK